ncbi:MAG: hypothetical protein QXY39_01930 [Thermofilaceae archaeon]
MSFAFAWWFGLTLYVDSSEASTSVGRRVLERLRLRGVAVVVKPVVGDYVFESQDGTVVCVERTSPSDFWGKLTSGRLFEQLQSELESCGELYYVIAGYRDMAKLVRFHGYEVLAQFEGALTVVSRMANLVVLWTDERFPSWLALLYEKLSSGKVSRAPSRVSRKRTKHPCELAVEMLTAIPGIGSGTAEQILMDYDSLEKALRAMLENPQSFLARYVRRDALSQAVAVIKNEGCRDWLRRREQG